MTKKEVEIVGEVLSNDPGKAKKKGSKEAKERRKEGTQGTTIQYNAMQYNTIQYNTTQYNAIQYNVTHCSKVRCYTEQLGAVSRTYDTYFEVTPGCDSHPCLL